MLLEKYTKYNQGEKNICVNTKNCVYSITEDNNRKTLPFALEYLFCSYCFFFIIIILCKPEVFLDSESCLQ